MGIQVKDSSREILARMFHKMQLTVFTLLVFACCVVSTLGAKGNRLNHSASGK